MTLRTDVSALYIDPRGPYPKLLADCWDEARDARNYAGPNPVVAHPPCGPWGNFKHMCWKQDRELAPLAIKQVRRWGGVLEHPAGSTLFGSLLPKPGEFPDQWGGIVIDVHQVAWGHSCIKPTRLYVVGAARKSVYAGIRSGGVPTHRSRRTPIAFAEWLISLAAQAKRTEAA